MRVARRDPEKEAFWRLVVEKSVLSGLSIREFCRREAISEPAFYAWRRELRKRDGQSPDQKSPADSLAATNGRNGRKTTNGAKTAKRNSDAVPLVPVKIVDETSSPQATAEDNDSIVSSSVGQIEIETPGGCRVRFHSAVEVAHLGDLLQTLMRCETSAADENPV